MPESRGWAARAAAAMLFAAATPAAAQIGFTNTLEGRVGRDPDEPVRPGLLAITPASRASFFDQLSLDWTRDRLRLGLRYETYVPSDTLVSVPVGGRTVPEYMEFVRRYASWTTERLEITVGNYDAIFGRGLVLRAFELPGVVREEYGAPQYGDSRDLDGVRLRAHGDAWELQALAGKPRRADEPPGIPRSELVEGASGAYQVPSGPRLSATYLRRDRQDRGPGSRVEVGGGSVQMAWDPWLRRAGLGTIAGDTYVEYAALNNLDLAASGSSPRAEPDAGYLLYAAQSLVLDEVLPGLRWGGSWEFKDYQNYEIGVNEPPTLVREHSFVLLNRSTHRLDPVQEHGYQFESRVDYRGWIDVVLHGSRAENARSRRFRERYVEVSGHLGRRTVTLFAGTAEDGVEAVRDRDTFGGFVQLPFRGPHSVEAELERQEATRGGGAFQERFVDRYASLTWSWAGRLSLAAVRQTTDDPNDATDPLTGEVSRRAFDSLRASVDLGQHHDLLLFWGRERGGIACTAGTCYKVRSFDGVSARLVSRF